MIFNQHHLIFTRQLMKVTEFIQFSSPECDNGN